MKFLSARFETVLIRYYLMMVVVILPFYLGVPYLSILAVPIFLSALMGIHFDFKRKARKTSIAKRERLPLGKAA